MGNKILNSFLNLLIPFLIHRAPETAEIRKLERPLSGLVGVRSTPSRPLLLESKDPAVTWRRVVERSGATLLHVTAGLRPRKTPPPGRARSSNPKIRPRSTTGAIIPRTPTRLLFHFIIFITIF